MPSYSSERPYCNLNHKEGEGDSTFRPDWLNDFFPEGCECKKCKSKNVELTYTDRNFSYVNGDGYYSWEFFCKDCKTYTYGGYCD